MRADLIEALRTVFQTLEGLKWKVIGSLALALQGMEPDLRDIDIKTSEEEIEEAGDRLKEFAITPLHIKSSGSFDSMTQKFFINRVEVETFSNLGLRSEMKPKTIKFEGMKIPVSPLEEQLEMYERLGRDKRVEEIKKFLDSAKL